MIMTLNEILTRQNLITKILLSHGDKELSKELKVKIMRMRMAYNKIKKQFDEDAQEFSKQLVSDELKTLANKQDKTEEETSRFEELNNKANSEYQEFLIQKGNEEIDFIDSTFTEEEYADILDINSDGEYEMNGHKIKAADLMEVFYGIYME
jgi:predicted ATP-dependent protease